MQSEWVAPDDALDPVSWQSELSQLAHQDLPAAGTALSPWAALAMRRDLRALLAEMPPHGISNLPPCVPNFTAFELALKRVVRALEGRCAEAAVGLALNRMFGPWEGGFSPGEAPTPENKLLTLPVKLAAWNVRGGFSQGGTEAHTWSIAKVVAQLQRESVVAAVISDPQFAPGMQWPEWSGYVFLGERTSEPASVALLVLQEATSIVKPIGQVGDSRAIWFEILPFEGNHSQVILCLGVYAIPPNHLPSERREFWSRRLRELQQLRGHARFANAKVAVLGDLNLHLSSLSAKDRALERPIDREIAALLTSPNAFNLQVCNLPNTPTHVAGTTIDLVFSSPSLRVQVHVGELPNAAVNSDHALLTVDVPINVRVCAQSRPFGRSQWMSTVDWESALTRIFASLQFVAAWCQSTCSSQTIRHWVASGKHKRLRQAMLDRACWWRTALTVIAGHLEGLARLMPPEGRTARNAAKDQLKAWFNHLFEDDGEAFDLDEAIAKIDLQFSHRHLAKLQLLASQDPLAAQRVLSGLLKPKLPLQLSLQNESTGNTLSLEDSLTALEEDILSRGEAACSGDPRINKVVEREIGVIRAEALAATSSDDSVFAPLDIVTHCCDALSVGKASFRLPRAAARHSTRMGVIVIWALVNLVGYFCLVPSTWAREVTPIRKRGPLQVDDLSNLRPVCFVCEVESVFDAVWLWRCRSRIEGYLGRQQHGGRCDSLIMALSIIVIAQLRLSSNLPTLIKKADLWQGFDLTWRSACLLQLHFASVRGRDWLLQDAAFGSDKFRVKLLHLVGPLRQLASVGVGQGKRTSVHLFNLVAKGLADMATMSPGVGLGFTAHEVGMALEGSSAYYRTHEAVQLDRLPQVVEQVSRSLGFLPELSVPPLPATHPATVAEKLVALEFLANSRVNLLQFVDDVFSLQSTAFGINQACRADNVFCCTWRHKFAGGSKRQCVLPVNCALPPGSLLVQVPEEVPQIVDAMTILGIKVDSGLTFVPFLDLCLARYVNQARDLCIQMRDHSIGLPFQVGELQRRVEPSALYGIAVMASHFEGWNAAARKLDTNHYAVLKEVLGISGFSLGEGGRSRIMHELGVHIRLSMRVAILVATVRARALCLTPCFEAWTAFQAAFLCKGANWMNDAEAVTRNLNLIADFPQYEPSMTLLRLGGQDAAKRAVACWKRQVLMPAVWKIESAWFQQQAQKWTLRHCTWAGGPLAASNFGSALLSVVWDRCMWKYFRMWCLARMTDNVPFGILGSRGQQHIGKCPLCEDADADLSLQHLLYQCAGVTFRPAWAASREILHVTTDLTALQAKILFLGRVVTFAWSRLTRT